MTHIAPLARRPYGKLSNGQKRQVQFAMAVCGRPRLLFLDEPTVGLDIQSRETMWATLRQLVGDGASIVLTTHYLEEAEALADRVVVLAKGRVVASGSVAEMRALVVRTRITCISALAVERVRTWPGVGSASRDRQRLEITATNAEAVVRQLLSDDEDVQAVRVEHRRREHVSQHRAHNGSQLVLRQAQRAQVVELRVDLRQQIGQREGARVAADEAVLGPRLRVAMQHGLPHRELVEVGLDEAADDRCHWGDSRRVACRRPKACLSP